MENRNAEHSHCLSNGDTSRVTGHTNKLRIAPQYRSSNSSDSGYDLEIVSLISPAGRCFLVSSLSISKPTVAIAMKAIMTPSILLSFVRRSRGFTHGFGSSFDVPVWCVDKPRNPLTARFTMTAIPGEGTATHPSLSALSPLGLDPENCTVAEIKHQLRRR